MKAKNKITGEIWDCLKIGNQYRINKQVIESSNRITMYDKLLSDIEFNELYEIVEDTDKSISSSSENGMEDRFNKEFVDEDTGILNISKYDHERLLEFIHTLLEKQREEIRFKLNQHWDKLESNNYDFKYMKDWRIFKCIRNNNNDVINDKTS